MEFISVRLRRSQQHQHAVKFQTACKNITQEIRCKSRYHIDEYQQIWCIHCLWSTAAGTVCTFICFHLILKLWNPPKPNCPFVSLISSGNTCLFEQNEVIIMQIYWPLHTPKSKFNYSRPDIQSKDPCLFYKKTNSKTIGQSPKVVIIVVKAVHFYIGCKLLQKGINY